MIQINPGSADPELVPLLERAVRTTLDHEGADVLEFSVTLLDDERIRELNRTYLSHDHVTDVISFPMEAPGGHVVGDVYIGHPQAERQAAEAGVPAEEELVRLAVHGTLHVLGHDHPDGDDRSDSPMYRLQETLVSRIMAPGS